jgi:peptidoglycan/LPS O-acetylase OafA/YrhL
MPISQAPACGNRLTRIDNLTGVRGIVALWVVLFHFNTLGMGRVIARGSFGVDIFFILSGLVLSIVYTRNLPDRFQWIWYKSFLARRFSKLYPMHLLTFLAMASLIAVGRLTHYRFTADVDNSFWTAFCNLLMMHACGLTQQLSWNAPSWSVSAEWFAYCAMFAPMVLLLRRVSLARLFLLGIVLWISLLLFCHSFLGSSILLTTNGVLRIIPEFFCGYLLFRTLQVHRPRQGDYYTCVGFALMGVVVWNDNSMEWLLLPAVMLLLTGLHSGGPLSDVLFGNRPTVILGEASYSIYLVQVFPVIVAHRLIARVGEANHLAAECIACATTLSVAACGVFSYLYIEEPLRKRLLRILSSTPQSNA